MRTLTICCVFLGLLLSWHAATAQAADPMLSHDVYFTLKHDSDDAREKLLAGCKKYLANHPGVVSFSAGILVEDHRREVNDRDFDVALHLVFKDKESHDKYQNADSHHKFIEEFQENWEAVRVFDSFTHSNRASGDEQAAALEFTVRPIGHVEKTDERAVIVLDKKHQPGLLGLEGFSHVYVFWWFSRNDTTEKRSVLQVNPMGNRENPLTGVFATRSPVRPNLIALTLCKVVSVKENVVEVEKIDAFDGTPVLDIKPFIPDYDSRPDATLPAWLVKARKQRDTKE